MSKLSKEEVIEIQKLSISEQAKYIILAEVKLDRNILFFIRGNGAGGSVSLDCFTPGKETPDFNQVEIIDYGQTVRFGDYEAAADYIIEESAKY